MGTISEREMAGSRDKLMNSGQESLNIGIDAEMRAILNQDQIERLELAARHKRNYIHASDEMFESLVMFSKIPVLIIFWSSWCDLCDAIMPLVDKIAGDYCDKLLAVKMDVSMSPDTPKNLKVQTLPTFIYMRDGKVVGRLIGSSNAKLIKFVADHTHA
ncbi:MAG: thioredoxin domain-containing protein [Pseudomonadota bacterium]|nr:thioredoxin domain-containing protein [Pseudomonadota bacterium]